MKTTLSWLREYVELPADLSVADLDSALINLGIEVESTPDRGYEMSVRGIARELSYAFGCTFTDPGAVPASPGTDDPPYPVQVDDIVGCDRFAARVIRGIDPTALSPAWMQRRLI